MKDGRKPKIGIIPLRKMAPFDAPSEMDFLVRIEAPEKLRDAARPSLNLGLVLDRSGSMDGGKIEKAKETACYCVDQLLPKDRISVTIFDDSIDVIVPTTEAKDIRKIKQAIQRISARGTTALHAGWVEGARQVAECADQGGINRVLLVTDGLANVGVTDPETIIAQAGGLLERGISTSTFGVGIGFNEDLLIPMAKAGGGNHEFIEGAEDFQRIFAREMEGLIREVCTRVGLRMEPAEGVNVLDVMNDFELQPDGFFSLPNLLAGEPLDVIVRVMLPVSAPGKFHCFKLILEWQDYGTDKRSSTSSSASISYGHEQDIDEQGTNLEVEKAVALLEGARVRRRAVEDMDCGRYQEAARNLQDYLNWLGTMPAAADDPSLHAEVQQLSLLSRDIEKQRDLAMARKSMVYQSADVQRGRRETDRSPSRGSDKEEK